MNPGKAWLVGAGPGDPELLTLKAVRAIAGADVILIDDLVDRRVLAHARAGVRVIDVGKRGGCRSTPQAFIEELLVREVRRGLAVVRLKGGDPFVFGRGGEELLALQAAGAAVEVVNGISAGIAAPAAIGVPLTHRGLCHGAILITAHSADGPGVDWPAVARAAASGLTLVIYMAMQRLDELCVTLAEAGLAATTPAAIVEAATSARQRAIQSTLRDLASARLLHAMASPAVVIIGEVVGLARREDLLASVEVFVSNAA
jgi:uroporphyrin-III C-methyltransferase